jgi:hypothetical protein
MSCCVCFTCVNRFGLTSDSSVSLDANADESKFPKIRPLCVKCFEVTQSPRAADLASATHRLHGVQNATAGAAMPVSIPKQVRWGLLIGSTTLLISYVFTLRVALAWRGFGWTDAPREVVVQTVVGMMFTPFFLTVLLMALSLIAVAQRVAWARWILFANAALFAVLINWATARAICLALVLANCVSVGLLFGGESSEWLSGASPDNRWRAP